jgi:hypothetical protein
MTTRRSRFIREDTKLLPAPLSGGGSDAADQQSVPAPTADNHME